MKSLEKIDIVRKFFDIRFQIPWKEKNKILKTTFILHFFTYLTDI